MVLTPESATCVRCPSLQVVKGLVNAGLCDTAGIVVLELTEAQLEPVLAVSSMSDQE